ncbi:hypothetical protein TNCV_1965511 [Trichonephila clavipes]|nr:hypothetical protein TNCV_1965511 [Trichonephila clavipes]
MPELTFPCPIYRTTPTGGDEAVQPDTGCSSVRQIAAPLSPPPQFRHRTGGEGSIVLPPALMFSAATAHKTFGPIDLTSMCSACTWRIFGGVGHGTQAFRSGVRYSNR